MAVLGMVAFHFCYDLRLVGLVDWDMRGGLLWRLFAGSVAGSFILLSGLSLGLAHGRRLKIGRFFRRLAILAVAAAGVSLATWAFAPAPVRFGILHAIAVFSLLGLPFLRAPLWLLAAVAAFCVLAPLLPLPRWEHWTAYPLGLSTVSYSAPDYEPVLPWFALTLAGIAASRDVKRRRTRQAKGGFLQWCGQHSLAIYLIHQPVLLGGLTVLARLF